MSKSFRKITAALCAVSFSVSPLFAADVIRPATSDVPSAPDLSASRGNELTLLDQLIDVTKQNLEAQKQLRDQLQEYLQVRNQYMQNTEDKELSMKMVKKAYQVLGKIQDQHLVQAFDREFISELTFFSNIAAKWKTPS